jgi:hypothetical protein
MTSSPSQSAVNVAAADPVRIPHKGEFAWLDMNITRNLASFKLVYRK